MSNTEMLHLTIKAKRKANSLTGYVVRAHKDKCLYDDIHAFVSKHDTGNDRLVDMLLDKYFLLARYTDPGYPA